ncbi:MAG: bactofilin family protein [Terriglobales bacterium]
MWKNPSEKESAFPPARPTTAPQPPAGASPAGVVMPATVPAPAPRAAERPTHLGKTVFVKGSITGGEDLYVDGRVEGTIDLAKNTVTIGLNGQVQADVTAREVVIQGKLSGNVTASDRVEIRAQGALTGDVTCARISIEDGAFFKGGIDIQKAASNKVASVG